jgi:hypothetical protein
MLELPHNAEGPVMLTVAVFTVTLVLAEAAVHPLALVTVTA